MAGPSRQLHGNHRCWARVPSARREGPRSHRRLSLRENAAGQCWTSRRPARMAAAWWRSHRRSELEIPYSVGGQFPELSRGCLATSGRSAGIPDGSELVDRPFPATREGQAREDRPLFRGRLNCAPLGRHRLSRAAGQLEAEFLRLERRWFRMGRRSDTEYSLAIGEWRTRRSESQGRRSSRRHK